MSESSPHTDWAPEDWTAELAREIALNMVRAGEWTNPKATVAQAWAIADEFHRVKQKRRQNLRARSW